MISGGKGVEIDGATALLALVVLAVSSLVGILALNGAIDGDAGLAWAGVPLASVISYAVGRQQGGNGSGPVVRTHGTGNGQDS